MGQAESRELILKKLNSLGSIHQAGIGRQAAPVVESPQDVQAEAMEGSDAECRSILRTLQGDPLGHFSCGLVREGQEKDAPWVNTFVQQAFDTCNERAGLPSSRPGLKQECSATMPSRVTLLFVEGNFNGVGFSDDRNGGQEQRIEHLLSYDFEGST